MSHRLVSLFAGFTLFITLIAAAPVRAGSQDDTLRALAGVFVLFAIGQALANEAEGNKATVTSTPTYPNRLRISPPQNAPLMGEANRKRKINRPDPTRARAALPAQCYFEVTRHRRLVGVYGAKCLSDYPRRMRMLPYACKAELPIRHGRSATVFDAACLREFGWAEERHARR